MRINYLNQLPSMPPACGHPATHDPIVGRFAVGSPILASIVGAQGTGVSGFGTFGDKDIPVAQAALAAGDVRGVPPRGKPV